MLILSRFMQPDVRRLVETSKTSRPQELKLGIEFLVSSFPVYRTYIRERTKVGERDGKILRSALKTARERARKDKKASNGLDILGEMLQSIIQTGGEPTARKFFMTLQQLTSSVVAKGIEDTAFYRYFPLSSLNEVGASPDRFGVSIEQFHQVNSERMSKWPNSMLATTTHDTKRSEDVRARINVLSELPEEWSTQLGKWAAMNEKFRSASKSPSRLLEYLFYQTLIGAADSSDIRFTEGMVKVEDCFVQRMLEYAKKASKEAKLETSWTFPDEEYDIKTERFVRSVLSVENRAFLMDFMEFASDILTLGKLNSLSQLILKMTVPGVPDFYQGTELFDYSLVDPDNRRPVDFSLRKDLLGKIGSSPFVDFPTDDDLGTVKLFLTKTVLNYRKRNHNLFAKGKYMPLKVTGKRKRNVIAFLRHEKEKNVIVLASRFFRELGSDGASLSINAKVWGKTYIELPKPLSKKPAFTNILTEEKSSAESQGGRVRLDLSEVFRLLPFAVLEQT